MPPTFQVSESCEATIGITSWLLKVSHEITTKSLPKPEFFAMKRISFLAICASCVSTIRTEGIIVLCTDMDAVVAAKEVVLDAGGKIGYEYSNFV
jgi:hypothetical protein